MITKILGTITHQDGWSGGEYLLGKSNLFGTLSNMRYHAKDYFLTIKGEDYPVIFWTENGVDYDHGHEYPYVKRYIGVELPVPLVGKVRHSVEQIFKKTKIRKIVLKAITEDNL